MRLRQPQLSSNGLGIIFNILYGRTNVYRKNITYFYSWNSGMTIEVIWNRIALFIFRYIYFNYKSICCLTMTFLGQSCPKISLKVSILTPFFQTFFAFIEKWKILFDFIISIYEFHVFMKKILIQECVRKSPV